MNTFFLCLTSIVLLILFDSDKENRGFVWVDLPILFLCSLMTLTQYAVVPYDMLSYFLYCLAILVIIHKPKAWWGLPVLCTIVILATLVRETSVFILAFYFAVSYKAILMQPIGFKINPAQAELLIITFCFLCTYFGLRLVLGYEQGLYQTLLLSRNMNLTYSLLGMLFFASIALLVMTTPVVRKEIAFFCVLTFPYAVFVFLFADPWEIRLWVPITITWTIMKMRASHPGAPQLSMEEQQGTCKLAT